MVELPDGGYVVSYTGVTADRSHGEMLYAAGPLIDRPDNKGWAMATTPSEGNIKEATVDRTKAGPWRLFYKYAAGGASLAGLAVGDQVDETWHHERQPFASRHGG